MFVVQAARLAAPSAAAATSRSGESRGPIVVLSYEHAGAELLREVLSASPSLTFTSGTGLLSVCHAAASTWRVIEARKGLSALAVTSIRTLAATMATVIQTRAGASRWCETSFAAPATATTFLEVFPSATILCLHRGLRGVLAEGIATYPWGLGGSPFWPYAAPHPGNNVATIAAYWAMRTEPLLDFEAQQAQCTMRVRYEDLAEEGVRVASAVYEFLGLDVGELPALRLPQATSGEKRNDAEITQQLDRLPGPLRAKISDLHTRLGYRVPV
jgi:hypothetical protein